MFKLTQKAKIFISAVAASFVMTSHAAVDVSQTPLLTQTGTVAPNLMLMMDDSGSMNAQYIYQYGGTAGGYGMSGPGVSGKKATCPTTLSIDTTCTYNAPSVTVSAQDIPAGWTAQKYDFDDWVEYEGKYYRCKRDAGCESSKTPGVHKGRWEEKPLETSNGAFYEVSPDVNRMYYDPRVLYKVRLTGVGNTTTTAATPSTSTDFYVFFYKNGSGQSAAWNGTGPDPTLASNYFSPYSSTAALTNTQSALASGADTTLSYPQCIGTGCAGGAGPFPKYAARTDCTGSNCSLLNEQQNYANWKKFHSNRIDLAKTGLGYAFQDIDETLRLGWSQINDISGTTLGSKGSGVGALNSTRKSAFYLWLYSVRPSGSTPLREVLTSVGKYFSRADNVGPWANTPVPTSNGLATLALGTTTGDTQAARQSHASCRRSFTLLMTDGYYNDDAPSYADTDYTAITQINGFTPKESPLSFNYDGRTLPYASASSFTTMADIAMKYWITDLRPQGSGSNDFGLKNNVPTTETNPSFWQNMGFYAVGLGIDGTLTQNSATLSGLTTWPTPPSDGDSTETIDDLWHATVNARGRMLSARNAEDLSTGVKGMLADINYVESSQSGVAASTLSLSTTTRKYTPRFTTGSWIGNVVASELDAKSGAELCTKWRLSGSWLTDPTDATKKHWYVANKYDGTSDLPPCTGSPTTFNAIEAHATRKIFAWNGSNFSDFNNANSYAMSSTTGIASGKSFPGDTNLMNYLRGDQSNEDVLDAKGVVVTAKSYRARQFVLGDIVNSTPTFIKGALNMEYNKLPAGTYGQASYNAFVTAKSARAEGVLFAGANDGMIHGFRETTGAEVFAFVPRAVMPKMHLLANRSYSHQYYVDGPTVEADACLTTPLTSCSTWSNLLLGTAGGGAKAVYALNVTNPMSMTTASIKWEISATPTVGSNFYNLGYILTDVQTGLTTGGQWVAVFGNGYSGGSGTNASLFVVDLDTGALIKEIVVPNNIPISGGDNGLGGVRLLRDANQRILAAYAGDLKGNLWKFDLSNTSSSSWAIGLSGSPLFKTMSGTVKPITAIPTVVQHPLNGNVVAFGTGKLFEAADVSNTVTQSLYGVWDSVTPAAKTQIDRIDLVQQTISSAIAGSTVITNMDGVSTSTVALNYYSVSRNPINWTTTSSTPRGWFIDLPNTGQRVVYPLDTLVGKFVAVDTVSPSNVSTNACLASGSGKAWNYVIDMVTGSGPAEAIYDTNGDKSITSTDLLVSGYENTADGRTRYIKNDSKSTSSTVFFTPLSTEQLPSFGISCRLTNTCASSTSIKRSWRQLFVR